MAGQYSEPEAQQILTTARTPGEWIARLERALSIQNPEEPLGAAAKAAVRACPGDGKVLALATAAHLLAGRPRQAEILLRRLEKRFLSSPVDSLLRALLWAQQNTSWGRPARCSSARG